MKLIQKIRELFSITAKVNNLNNKINDLQSRLNSLENHAVDLKILNARIYSKLLKSEGSTDLADHEFKVFSQYGDDGIIQYLINNFNISSKTFVEFGVESYKEANTRFLLLNNNWRGLIIDGSEEYMNQVKKQNMYWLQNLTAVSSFVTAENINGILSQNGFTGELGILHIDIDGNDYWIWKAIEVVNPQIVIVEYNAVFGLKPWTVPYDPAFERTKKHHSNLYFGASVSALNSLAEKKGYSFVGCNSAGNNAYFVRNDKISSGSKVDVAKGYVNSQFRESRDVNGNLTFVSGEERINLIKNLPVYNTETGQIESI